MHAELLQVVFDTSGQTLKEGLMTFAGNAVMGGAAIGFLYYLIFRRVLKLLGWIVLIALVGLGVAHPDVYMGLGSALVSFFTRSAVPGH